MGTGLGRELRARSPLGLVFAEPGIGGDLPHRLKSGVGTLHLCDSERTIDGDHRRVAEEQERVIKLHHRLPIGPTGAAATNVGRSQRTFKLMAPDGT